MQNYFEKLFTCIILRACLLFVSVSFSFIFFITNSLAQDGLSGFYRNYTGFQLYNDYELVAGRNRIRGEYSDNYSFGALYLEVDLIDRYTNERDFELLIREAYLDWFTSSYDVRIGKQNIIWGKATGSFVTDILSPVDLREFLTQDVADLRLGLTSINLRRYFGRSFLQFVAAPALQPDLLPDQDSRWFPVQRPPSIIPFSFRSPENESTLSDIQLAARFAWRPSPSFDIDFMAYHWAHPMPAYAIEPNIFGSPLAPEVTLRETYRTSPMAGYAASWQISDSWILSSESLFVYERLFTFLPVSTNRLEDALNDPLEAFQVLQEFDIRDDGYLLTKPWLQTMIGGQTDLAGATVGLQGYVEIILNYEDRILPQRVFPYASLFAQRSFLRDRISTFMTGRYNFFGQDFWAQIQAEYEINDGFQVALGTNIFEGPSISPFYGHLTFEQFKENSFIFAKTTIYF